MSEELKKEIKHSLENLMQYYDQEFPYNTTKRLRSILERVQQQVSVEPEVKPTCDNCKHVYKDQDLEQILYCGNPKFAEYVGVVFGYCEGSTSVNKNFGCIDFERSRFNTQISRKAAFDSYASDKIKKIMDNKKKSELACALSDFRDGKISSVDILQKILDITEPKEKINFRCWQKEKPDKPCLFIARNKNKERATLHYMNYDGAELCVYNEEEFFMMPMNEFLDDEYFIIEYTE